jgi:hypothetical protein
MMRGVSVGRICEIEHFYREGGMSEPVVTLGVSALAAYLSKDGLEKLLGPTAEYLGQGLCDFTKKRAETIGQIFKRAEAKLGDRMAVPGTVPPKVLKAVLDDGSFSNELLAVEYLGGILASSRSDTGRDDRGARLAKMLDGLSTYQLRTHYLIYGTARTLFAGKGANVNGQEGRAALQMFLPYDGFIKALDLSESEQEHGEQLLTHTFFGLHADDLLDGLWRYGSIEYLQPVFPAVKEGGIICQPSALGAELFLWAFGHSDKPLSYLFSSDFSHEVDGIPGAVSGACATKL